MLIITDKMFNGVKNKKSIKNLSTILFVILHVMNY